MELLTFPAILGVAGAILSSVAVVAAFTNLKVRLKAENDLYKALAKELKSRNIVFESIEINKETISIEKKIISEDDVEKYKNLIEDVVYQAIKSLQADEKTLVEKTLQQPSCEGKNHYLRKIVNNSLNEIYQGTTA